MTRVKEAPAKNSLNHANFQCGDLASCRYMDRGNVRQFAMAEGRHILTFLPLTLWLLFVIAANRRWMALVAFGDLKARDPSGALSPSIWLQRKSILKSKAELRGLRTNKVAPIPSGSRPSMAASLRGAFVTSLLLERHEHGPV